MVRQKDFQKRLQKHQLKQNSGRKTKKQKKQIEDKFETVSAFYAREEKKKNIHTTATGGAPNGLEAGAPNA